MGEQSVDDKQREELIKKHTKQVVENNLNNNKVLSFEEEKFINSDNKVVKVLKIELEL